MDEIINILVNLRVYGFLRAVTILAHIITVGQFLFYLHVILANVRTQPDCFTYFTDLSVTFLLHAEDRRIAFFWQELQPRDRVYRHCTFAVHFGFRTDFRYGAFDLAWMILRFTDLYSHSNQHLITPIRVSYLITPTIVVGILLFDDSIRPVFNMISTRGFFPPEHEIPMSTWPDTVDARQYLANIHRVRLIFRLTT